MVWQRKSPAKGERVVKRKRRDGSEVIYRYAAYKPRKRTSGDTIGALIEAYRRSPEWSALSKRTHDVRLTYFRVFDGAAQISVGSVKRRDIMALRDGVITGSGRGAANGFLAAASALFRWAVDREWIEHSPVVKIAHSPGGHLSAWTRQEADDAARLLPEPYRRAVVLARHTGQRRGDLCAMTWAAYDGATLRLTQQKTKPGSAPVNLVIPCAPALREELNWWKCNATAVTILTTARGNPWPPAGLSKYLPIAMEAVGLPPLGIHGLRKLAATELADAGCTPHEIAAITGHRTLAMVELYTRTANQRTLADGAVVKLAEHRQKKS